MILTIPALELTFINPLVAPGSDDSVEVNMSEERFYSSGELQRLTGCTRKAMRHYQANGLISTARTTGKRLYNEDALYRLHLIAALREIGLGVDQIRPLLEARDSTQAAGPVADEFADQLSDLIQTVQVRIDALRGIRNQLVVAREELAECTGCEHELSECRGCIGTKLGSVSRVLLSH